MDVIGSAATEVRVVPTGARLGADIEGVDLSQPLSEAQLAAIERAWMDNLVLRFRGQDLTDENLVTFSRHFGTLDHAPRDVGKRYFVEHREILVVSNVIENGEPIGALGNYESDWHTDMSYVEEPPNASILYALEVPPSGGDTSFADMYAAFEALPAGERERLTSLRCKHDSSKNSTGQLRDGFAEVTDPRDAPGAVHPLVRTHPVTKRKALYLGRRKNAYVLGLSLEESEALLDRLWVHALRPEFTWTQRWKPQDLVMWDNRCVMHRRDEFDPNVRRIMHRTQVQGERPF